MASEVDKGKLEVVEDNADLKIILLGDSALGKSKLVERFLLDDYVPRQLVSARLAAFGCVSCVSN